LAGIVEEEFGLKNKGWGGKRMGGRCGGGKRDGKKPSQNNRRIAGGGSGGKILHLIWKGKNRSPGERTSNKTRKGG